MMKKGQAAMEFLMTYGWAILVVLAAIGALAYFGVLSPGNLLPEKTTFSAPFISTESAVITISGADVTVQIPMTNGNSGSVTINTTASTAIGDGDCATVGAIATNDADDVIATNDEFIVTWTCTGAATGKNPGDKFRANLGFTYTTGSGLVRTHSGSVTGTMS